MKLTGDHNQSNMALPELYKAQLDLHLLQELFTDIEACTQLLNIQVKDHTNRYTDSQSIDLETAKSLLLLGEIRGLQLRYWYKDAEWCDTIINSNGYYLLTRINSSSIEKSLLRD